MQRKTFLPLALLAFLSLGWLSACNTISGMGEDVEALGDTIEDEAEENKTY